MYLSNGIFQKAVIDFLNHKKKKFVKCGEALVPFNPNFIVSLKIIQSTDIEAALFSLENLSFFCEVLREVNEWVGALSLEKKDPITDCLKNTFSQIFYMANFIKITAQHQLDEA